MLANLLLDFLNETKITVVLHLNLTQVGVVFASIPAYNVLGASKKKADSNLKIYLIIYHYLHWKIFIMIYVLKILADLRHEICTKNKYLHNGCCHVAQTIFCVIIKVLVNFTAITT